MAEQTLNIPQLVAVVLVGFLAIRWFLSSSGSQGSSSSRGGTRPANPAHIEQVHQMFPQLERRTIAWDLQRNGGNVQATTEVVLSGRTLPVPPPSFQPPGTTSAASQSPSSTSQTDKQTSLPDLITRYNLSSKVSAISSSSVDASAASEAERRNGWSQNKTERSELLKRRREEMILAARRKMEERDRQGKAST